MLVPMELARIIIVENGESQVIVLRERDGERCFPILIGITEALAIERGVKSLSTSRPMTHDLAASIIKQLNAELEQIVIHDLRDHTFFAKLILRHDGKLIEVDCRPSDAIAMGVVASTPILVAERVLNEVCPSEEV
ncbi:MAG: bifunctional nuclease family protein [Phycisphaerae bacterium]|nr:bifunctional nuclease family protein [Phycisphaerae bacterium]